MFVLPCLPARTRSPPPHVPIGPQHDILQDDDDIDFSELAQAELRHQQITRTTDGGGPAAGGWPGPVAAEVAGAVGPAVGKENVCVGNAVKKNPWKPQNQPMWRGGAATIWQKPEQTASQARAHASALAPARVNRVMQREEDDPYRGWSTPGTYGEGEGNPTGVPTGATENNVPADWFESSDDDDGDAVVAPQQQPWQQQQQQVLPPPQQVLPLPPPQQVLPLPPPHHQQQQQQQEMMTTTPATTATSGSLYEDWYYEKRPMLRGTPVQDLASCSTTTGGIQVCRNAAQHWVYPSQVPERKYQLHAISRALFSNTLVCYPTGLGKTLIAAVVMQNFCRWFPKSKVVFIAPTKPLVAQQMKACKKFMGLDESAVMEMTGRASGENRKAGWNDAGRRVYFCTPQAFWNDVKRGICPYDLISCIVVDECHRAVGQADIVKAVKDMRNSKQCKFRVLGLSATPGSSHEQVQEVIDSLGISTLVFKDEADKDVAPYVHNKRSETVVVNPECSDNAARGMLMATLQRIVGDLSSKGHYYGPADAERVTRYGMQQAKRTCKSTSWEVSGRFVQASVLADVRWVVVVVYWWRVGWTGSRAATGCGGRGAEQRPGVADGAQRPVHPTRVAPSIRSTYDCDCCTHSRRFARSLDDPLSRTHTRPGTSWMATARRRRCRSSRARWPRSGT